MRTRARLFPVKVEHGDTIAKEIEAGGARESGGRLPGPYVVETFPVTIEHDYIVVTTRPRVDRSPTDASL